MVVDTVTDPDPWLLEDLQLRCDLAAERMDRALTLGHGLETHLPARLRAGFAQGLEELDQWRRRTRAYVHHARETNLATVLRRIRDQGGDLPEPLLAEMRALLEADRANRGQPEPVSAALDLLGHDPNRFLDTYFLADPDTISKGWNSLTSR
jgi:hypothetical protein